MVVSTLNSAICVCLASSLALAAIECVDNECGEDPIKNDLLSWYDEWMKGFEVDYITVNELQDSYDFIIAGAGIGGSIVAHRLAMDSSHPKVLLLEAGSKHNTSGLSNQMVPYLGIENQLSDIDWQYRTEPPLNDQCCKWNKNGQHQMPRGKVMGGSSVLNTEMWVRGHKEDWDILFNVDNWKWKDVLPYFKKSESVYHHNQTYTDNIARGYDGPIIINDARNLIDKNSIFAKSVVDACVGTKKFKFLENGQNSN
eukprot:223383_1